jgi:hypothetical protein
MAAPSGLRRQLDQAAAQRQRKIQDFRVQRVLAMLKDDNLAKRAAASDAGTLVLECNFVNEVWSDPRVASRVKQLGDRGVVVQPIIREHEVAGRHFSRTQIRVAF